MKTFRALTSCLMILICLSLTFTACSDDDDNIDGNASVVGTWVNTKIDWGYTEATLILNKDNTFHTIVEQKYDGELEKIAEFEGTYEYKNGYLILSTEDETSKSKVISVTREELKLETSEKGDFIVYHKRNLVVYK